LAAVHDPTGAIFNIDPVVQQEDGTVLSVEALKRRQERAALKVGKANNNNSDNMTQIAGPGPTITTSHATDVVDPARAKMIEMEQASGAKAQHLSKTQQKKLASLQARPPPPKPVIPFGFSIPEGEENWLALWDLSDDELERRVIRGRRRKAAGRKALRVKQKEGKVERRAARDEKRKVYRDLKDTWKLIKGM